MRLNGSDIVMECLLEQGVDTVFGFPGGAALNIYDALYKYSDRIKHYLTAHEQGASHAADGYARASGKAGVCFSTSGPGATNLVTGIATAYMDSIPLIAITSNVALPLLGKDSFQEVDIAGITIPITKHNFIVKDVTKLADTIRRAFQIALTGRPGPVLIDITKDVSADICDFERREPLPVKRMTEHIRESDLLLAAELISECKKPLILCGGGVGISGAEKEFREFAELVNAPVCSSSMGLGGFPTTDNRFIGMIGMHGTKAASLASIECDLLIAVGMRFSDRIISKVTRFAPNARILHIDVDPAEINKNVTAYASIVGDALEVLSRLSNILRNSDKPNNYNLKNEWLEHIIALKSEYPLTWEMNDGILRPQYIMCRISELTRGRNIIVTEVGQHQMWACHYIDYDIPRTFISSGGLGTMGYGLGAAIGAKIARPDKIVFNIAGDGCFRMNNIELAGAVDNNIPIIVAIMNNHTLGMVRQWQSMFYGGRFSHTTLKQTTDFVKLAEAHNAVGINVTRIDEVDGAILRAIDANCPVVINFEIPQDEKVFPMVPPGAGIDEIVLE